jgi:hypothetical protein
MFTGGKLGHCIKILGIEAWAKKTKKYYPELSELP